MKMKYFRFLYGETEQCFVHLGEITDTFKNEHFTFLYLRGTDWHVDQKSSEHRLFLCPNHLDLVVLGKADAHAKKALRAILADATVGTLVIPEQADVAEIQEKLTDVRVVRLNSAEGMEREASGTWEVTDENCAASGGAVNSLRFHAVGWYFLLKAYTEDSIVMLHGLDTDAEQFDDCVMSVKTLNAKNRCKKEAEPDGYGCALGCTLHQDYDVCKYRDAELSYVTGTLLLPPMEGAKIRERIESDMEAYLASIRFFGLSGAQEEGSLRIPSSECKIYFIGTESELGDKAIADICRGGLSHVPVVLKEGQGICCSGLLKYSE